MSTTIEYRHVGVKVDLALGKAHMRKLAQSCAEAEYLEPLYDDVAYLLFVESGSNNTITHDGKVARDWGLPFAGNRNIDSVIRASVGAEGGMVKLRGRDVQAETYIKHYRKLEKEARVPTRAPQTKFRLDTEILTPKPGREWKSQRLKEHPLTGWLLEQGHLKVIDDDVYYGSLSDPYYLLTVPSFEDYDQESSGVWHACMAWLIHLGDGGYSSDRDWRLDLREDYELDSWLDRLVSQGQGTLGF